MQRIVRGFRLGSDYTYTQTDLTKKICLIRKVSERGHSVAASVNSEDTKVNKAGKRVPKDERRAMVESYVIKYKEVNDGKFPSASETMKQVGGGYYFIRNTLQEIEHRSKAPHGNTMHESALRKEATDVAVVTSSHPNRKTLSEMAVKQKKTVEANDVNSAYSDVKSASAKKEPKDSTLLRTTLSDNAVKPIMTRDVLDHCDSGISAEEISEASAEEAINPKKIVEGDVADPGYSNFKVVAAEEEPKASTLSRKTLPVEVVKTKDDNSCNIGKRKYDSEVESEEVVVHIRSEKREHDVKDILTSEGPYPQSQQPKPSPGSNKFEMGNSEKQTNNEEFPKQQSMWVNLKSLADGIMKIWKGL